MGPYEIFGIHTIAAGGAGLAAHWHIAAWKLSTESIDSPLFVTRWIYRYLIFSFYYLLALLFTSAPILWASTKIQSVNTLVSAHPWLILASVLIPTGVLYYLYRRYLIWCDPVKIGARESALAYLRSRAGR